ncbi:cytochrome c biogenesis protein CcsA [Ignicoccus hospitalis]|uniref:Cytochrome c assembly protein n=1 Tax=Ignicoccus hospitalis (strain KIN4/I / DSM 18386 / JCM 14125) TaxID=453591 RepID=A8A995_IGNH4|nr:cytochrome c biogenesis protein CcsA [Ignicoccus hospitalis]ABU81497.1 cytochrome c assembly protein [Ignicoccus hospitalis KIN4/I]HIH90431.1 cytochrome c biogenesis protein CcsA [Desulfurococcaceae archaeon]
MLHWTGYPPLVSAALLAVAWYYALKKQEEKAIKFVNLGTLVMTVAWVLYVIPFVTLDFSLHEVYWNSSEGLPLWMRVATSWSGGGGSLFLYTFIATIALWWSRRAGRAFLLIAIPLVLVGLFAAYMNDAFALIPGNPVTGAGLNPLLKSPWLYPHPLTTFAGYALLAISAVALALGHSRARVTYNVGWALLTIGIALGAYWSYETFGWGGYWAWDPVETSELSVWLTATVLPHLFPLAFRAALAYSPLVTSSVYQAMFVTRTGLSPLHSFAGANLGSAVLFFTAVATFLWWVKEISDNYKEFVGIVKRVVEQKEPYYVGTALAFSSLLVAALFVYATLFVPSLLVIMGREASIPQQSSGINYFHPVLYPLLVVMLVAMPLVFLNEAGWRVILSAEAAALLLSTSMAVAAYLGELNLAYFSPKLTNVMMAFGIPLAAFSLVTAIYYIIKRYKLVRDWGIALLHAGVALTAIGVFMSGTYAYNNSYFFDFNLRPDETHSLPGGSKLYFSNYKYELSDSMVDIKSKYLERSSTYFYAWLALKTISQDLSMLMQFLKQANQTINSEPLLKELLTILKEKRPTFANQGMLVYSLGPVEPFSANYTYLNISDVTTGKYRVVKERGKLFFGNNEGVVYFMFDPNGNVRYYFALLTRGLGIDYKGNLTFHEVVYARLERPVKFKIGDFNVTAKGFTVYPMGNLLEVHGLKSFTQALEVVDGNVTAGGKEYPNGATVTSGFVTYLQALNDPVVSTILEDKELFEFLSNPKNVEKLITPPKGHKCLNPHCEGYVNAPQYVPETIRLDLDFYSEKGGQRHAFHTSIRYEAYGEIQGIHGLVPKVVHPSYGLTDLYVALNPPVVFSKTSNMISYHDMLLMYLNKVFERYNVSERLALAALFAAGYNINVIKQVPQTHLPGFLEQAAIELYLLAKNYRSHIPENGLYVQAKMIPGVPFVWLGSLVMTIGSLIGAVAYKVPRAVSPKL